MRILRRFGISCTDHASTELSSKSSHSSHFISRNRVVLLKQKLKHQFRCTNIAFIFFISIHFYLILWNWNIFLLHLVLIYSRIWKTTIKCSWTVLGKGSGNLNHIPCLLYNKLSICSHLIHQRCTNSVRQY